MNDDLKMLMKDNNVYFWQLADALGMSESTIYRRFRHELSIDEKQIVKDAISLLKKNNNES